jgi:hypothetical protein
MSLISYLMYSFDCSRVPDWFHVSPEEAVVRASQEVWLARWCHQNVQWHIQQTLLSNAPSIHEMSMLRNRLLKSRACHGRRQNPILKSPLLNIVLMLQSLYSCLFYISARPIDQEISACVKWHVTAHSPLFLPFLYSAPLIKTGIWKSSHNTSTSCMYTWANTKNVRMYTKS